MKSQKYLILILLFLLSFKLYSQQTDEDLINEAKRLTDEGKSIDNKTPILAKEKFDEAVNIYLKLINKSPDSGLLSKAYHNLGFLYCDNIHDYESSVKYFKEGGLKFPNTKTGKQCLFMTSFIVDEKIKDKNAAIILYKEFLEKYPIDLDSNDKLSESAKIRIYLIENNLGITDVIRRIEYNEKTKNLSKKNPGDDIFTDEDSLEYRKCYVVVVDTGRNYYALREKMFSLQNKLGIGIDTMFRGYIKWKNLIAFPEDFKEDPDYTGSYFPRRYDSDYLSLEYLNYYTRIDFDFDNIFNKMTIALVAGVLFDEANADLILKKIKMIENKAFTLSGRVFLGCMH